MTLTPEQLSILYEDRSTVEAQFWSFHFANPHIYSKLVQIELKSKDPFKLNNNYTSHYARLVMNNESDLRDFFELRNLRARR